MSGTKAQTDSDRRAVLIAGAATAAAALAPKAQAQAAAPPAAPAIKRAIDAQ